MDIFPIRRPPDAPTETLVPDLSDGAEAGLYLALFELVEEGLIITSDETILEVNSAACHLLDRSYPQLVGQPLAELFPTEAAFLAARGTLFVEGAMRGSLLLRMPDGQRRHLRCLSAARVRPGVHALVLSPDTAGLTEIAPTPVNSDKVWPRLAAAIREPVLVVNQQGRVHAANAAAQFRLGREFGPLVGAEIATLALDAHEMRRLPGPRRGWELVILPATERSAPAPAASERHRLAFRHMPLPALVCDEELRIADVNDAAAQAYGCARNALIGRPLPELVSQPVEADEIRRGGIQQHLTTEGHLFEVDLQVAALEAPPRRAELLLVHRPIHEPSAVQRYAAELFGLAEDGVMVLDHELRIVAVNPALCRLCGFPKEALLGEPASMLIAQATADPFDPANLAASGRWRGEPKIRRNGRADTPGSLQIARVARGIGRPPHYLATLRERSEPELPQEPAPARDPLTGLPDRRGLATRYPELSGSARRARRRLGVIVVDLDGFHRVNASLGEGAGDAVLLAIAERATTTAGPEAVVARVGPDSFVVLAAGLAGTEAALRLAERLLAAIAAPLAVASAVLTLAASAGVALQPDHGEDLAALLGGAELALAEARRSARTVCLYDPAQRHRELARSSLEAALWGAPERGELRLYWQPRYRLADSTLLGAEALLRWQHPQLGLLDAEFFVPAAIRAGRSAALGDWALENACAQMAAWRQAHACALGLSIDVGPAQLGQAGFAGRLGALMERHALPAATLELELENCAALPGDPEAMSNLYALQELGVGLRVNRFGADGAPLAVLRHLPVSGLKIDAQFVRDLGLVDEGPVLIEAMLAAARGLSLDVVAAGVDHSEQRDRLAAMGCHAGQGRLHGEAVGSEEFGRLLEAAFGRPPR